MIEGSIGPIAISAAPVAGTDGRQSIVIGGTPSQAAASTFRLSHEGFVTSAIAWSSTNTSLVASIDAALEALPSIGTGGVTTAAGGNLTNGVGNVSVTFAGSHAKKAVPTIVAYRNDMTGSSPTLSVTESVAGVDATYRGAATGSILVRTDNGTLYVNTSTTPGSPTWTAQV